MRLVWGTVVRVVEEAEGVQRLEVSFAGSPQRAAVAYPALTGRCAAGDTVLLNTTAVDLDLGTGGEHFVVSRAGTGVALDDASGGHVMKLRYTPLQRDVVAVEEPASGSHARMADARSLEGMPVVCCGLHSQVPLVAAAVRDQCPGARIAYVMTDAAALPMPVSRLVPRLLATGLLDVTVTTGQAFGGMLEAVNVYSGLLAARHVAEADVAIVSIGPGITGTATPFGHGGVAQGEALNAATALGGTAVAALRVSFADARPRHVPVSHQTLTALVDVAARPVEVAVPVLGQPHDAAIEHALSEAGVWRLHHACRVQADLPDLRGVEVSTMGRGYADDPAFFLAAAAAGLVAAERLGA